MKKIFAIILCAAALVGCSYGEGGENNTPATENMVTVTLNTGTRTHINSENTRVWSAGDKIAFVVNNQKFELTLKEGENTAVASFRGPISISADAKEGDTFTVYAYYPADADVTLNNGVITYNHSKTDGEKGFMYTAQKEVALTAHPTSVGYELICDDFTFYRTMAVVKVDLTNYADLAGYAGCKLVSNTPCFYKTATITTGNGAGSISYSNAASEIVCASTSAPFYMAVLPWSASATITASMYDANNTDLTARVFSLSGMTAKKMYKLSFSKDDDALVEIPDMSDAPSDFRGGDNLLRPGNVPFGTCNNYYGLNVNFDDNENPDIIMLDATQKRQSYGNTGSIGAAASGYNQAAFYFPISEIAKIGGVNGTTSSKVLFTFDAFVLYSADCKVEGSLSGINSGDTSRRDYAILNISGHDNSDWSYSNYGTTYTTINIPNQGDTALSAGALFLDNGSAATTIIENYPRLSKTSEYWTSYSLTITNFNSALEYIGFMIKPERDTSWGFGTETNISFVQIRNVTMQYVE